MRYENHVLVERIEAADICGFVLLLNSEYVWCSVETCLLWVCEARHCGLLWRGG